MVMMMSTHLFVCVASCHVSFYFHSTTKTSKTKMYLNLRVTKLEKQTSTIIWGSINVKSIPKQPIVSSLTSFNSFALFLLYSPHLYSPSWSIDSSSLDSQFDQKSINELNEHLYDSFDTLPNSKAKVDATDNNNSRNYNKYDRKHDNVLRPKHLILCLSNDHLEFIDADAAPPPPPSCSKSNNERFISMIPQNSLSPGSSNRSFVTSDWDKVSLIQKSLHKFIEIDIANTAICQTCHKLLSFRRTYKCAMCDFTCHKHCVDKVSHLTLYTH